MHPGDLWCDELSSAQFSAGPDAPHQLPLGNPGGTERSGWHWRNFAGKCHWTTGTRGPAEHPGPRGQRPLRVLQVKSAAKSPVPSMPAVWCFPKTTPAPSASSQQNSAASPQLQEFLQGDARKGKKSVFFCGMRLGPGCKCVPKACAPTGLHPHPQPARRSTRAWALRHWEDLWLGSPQEPKLCWADLGDGLRTTASQTRCCQSKRR